MDRVGALSALAAHCDARTRSMAATSSSASWLSPAVAAPPGGSSAPTASRLPAGAAALGMARRNAVSGISRKPARTSHPACLSCSSRDARLRMSRQRWRKLCSSRMRMDWTLSFTSVGSFGGSFFKGHLRKCDGHTWCKASNRARKSLNRRAEVNAALPRCDRM